MDEKALRAIFSAFVTIVLGFALLIYSIAFFHPPSLAFYRVNMLMFVLPRCEKKNFFARLCCSLDSSIELSEELAFVYTVFDSKQEYFDISASRLIS